MRVFSISVSVLALVALAACGPSTPAPEAPETPADAEESAPSAPPAPPPASDGGEGDDGDAAAPKPAADVPDPSFGENASVDEAIKAVPQGIERRNIDPETLAKPLQDLSLYEPCKPGAAKVTLRVAVWNGKAVGIDITTTPKNDKLADCIKGKLREVTWDKKVKSLNTIEYQF
jgi:hypothetical protein